MPDDGLMTTAEVKRSAVGPASAFRGGGSFGGNRDSGRLGAVRVPAPHVPAPWPGRDPGDARGGVRLE